MHAISASEREQNDAGDDCGHFPRHSVSVSVPIRCARRISRTPDARQAAGLQRISPTRDRPSCCGLDSTQEASRKTGWRRFARLSADLEGHSREQEKRLAHLNMRGITTARSSAPG
jgi:hypothetical protein